MAQAAVPPLPSLAAFLERFSALVFSPFCPPSIFVHSPSDSPILLPALQQVLNSAIQPSDAPASDPPTVEQLLPKVAHLDLSEVHSVKAAFDRILSQLSGWELADGTAWEERDGGIKGWDGSMDGIKVVKRRKTKRKAGQALEGRTAKRARREDSEDLYAAPDEDAGEAEDPDDGDEAEWTLEWDADARAAADKPTLAPLRNTVDAIHHSLRTIYSASSSGDSFTTDLLADPTSVDNLPRRRFILVEHGELLSEVAGGSGTGGGVARETGVGLTFASTMHRLAELTGLPITTILVSKLPWRKARESMVGLVSPEILTFEDISAADTVTLLTDRFAASPASHPCEADALDHDQLVELFRSLALIVKTTFGKAVNDFEDYAYLCTKFWPRWKDVREKSNPPIAPSDTARLSIALKSDFAQELDRLFLPRLSQAAPTSAPAAPTALTAAAQAAPVLGFTGTISALPKQPTYLDSPAKTGNDFFASASTSASPARPSYQDDPFAAPAGPSTPIRKHAVSAANVSSGSGNLFSPSSATTSRNSISQLSLAKSLPIASRYLLIAAHFAANNPPKSDVRMFVRVDELEGVAKKGKKARKASAKKAGQSPTKGSASVLLRGGKSFAYERLIAIFESIVDLRLEYALGTTSIAGQVQTLLHLRLLSRASSENNTEKILDGVKLKCGLARDTVDALAVSVGWKEWKERLVGDDS
ncbi:hypothetical protein NBRC10512_002008 [Rhodotorula toruloides]|uniref:RHTO0S03e10396g1_1 n=2 Tax=Rhodotorula toruloides TaxID=5286 RepID=A0A061AN11_RHOTO|nr:Origin recognition complex, subunit 5 [Rhodotorula toruloides NP11]EMS26065.1 Origin recognition complex, subunit 5 [Rhodotorula toruloides NP11]CDR38517.1 RHTO0S03e10396g1_1 [Rhodotorula toruloides]